MLPKPVSATDGDRRAARYQSAVMELDARERTQLDWRPVIDRPPQYKVNGHVATCASLIVEILASLDDRLTGTGHA
jgi:hypothetical protein